MGCRCQTWSNISSLLSSLFYLLKEAPSQLQPRWNRNFHIRTKWPRSLSWKLCSIWNAKLKTIINVHHTLCKRSKSQELALTSSSCFLGQQFARTYLLAETKGKQNNNSTPISAYRKPAARVHWTVIVINCFSLLASYDLWTTVCYCVWL